MQNKNVVSEEFLTYYKAEVHGYTYYNKNQYTALLKATKKITDKDIPENYFKFWDTFKTEKDSTASSFYQNALQNHIEYRALEKTGKTKGGTEQAWHEMFRVADSLLDEHPLSLQKQKTAFLLLLIKYFNFDHLTATELDIYKKQFPSSLSLPVLENLWNKKRGVVSVTPSFRLKNTRGEFVDIKDLRGNVIYIDFWGSWCKACLINMPHAEKLKARFNNNGIEIWVRKLLIVVSDTHKAKFPFNK
jgi:thiol-disulfide isomerase/thioredoxin